MIRRMGIMESLEDRVRIHQGNAAHQADQATKAAKLQGRLAAHPEIVATFEALRELGII